MTEAEAIIVLAETIRGVSWLVFIAILGHGMMTK